MSFLKKMRRKGRSKIHQELPLTTSVPSLTVECAKDKCLLDKKDTVREESTELAIYVETEIKVVERELLSLHKVMVKLELEMKEAIDTEDCEVEFESLSLDWLALNKFRSELDQRKQDLLTLSRQENGKECLKFLRQDLKCLFEVKGWKKTKEHKDQEKNVLDLILKLTNMA